MLPYHSHFLNMRQETAPYDLPADTQLLGALREIHQRRCTPCHTAEEVTRADWIDLRQPAASLFLSAPLSAAIQSDVTQSDVTTRRRCAKPPYADVDDVDYQAALGWVSEAVQRAWAAPRRDLRGLLPQADQRF